MQSNFVTSHERARTLFIISIFVLLVWYAMGDAYISILTSNFTPFVISIVTVISVAVLVARLKKKILNQNQSPRNMYIGFGMLFVLSIIRVINLQVYLISGPIYSARQFIDVGGVIISLLTLFISWVILETT